MGSMNYRDDACRQIRSQHSTLQEAINACRNGDYRGLEEIMRFLMVKGGWDVACADPDMICELSNDFHVDTEELEKWLDGYEATSIYVRFCLAGQGSPLTPRTVWEHGVKSIPGLTEMLQVGLGYQEVYFRICPQSWGELSSYGQVSECTLDDVRAQAPPMP